jgi:hypothetical protein
VGVKHGLAKKEESRLKSLTKWEKGGTYWTIRRNVIIIMIITDMIYLTAIG